MRSEFQDGFSLVGKVWPSVTTKALYEGRFSRGIYVGGKSLAKCVTTTVKKKGLCFVGQTFPTSKYPS
jgi:hypothetical protein